MSDNPEALREIMQLAYDYATSWPGSHRDRTRAPLEAAIRALMDERDAALAQQAATPPLKPQDGDDDDLRLALDLIDKIKTAETNGGLLSAVMLYRFEIRKRCIAAAAQQAATPAPAEPPSGWRLVLVNDKFDALMTALDRATRKGYMPDAVSDEWEAFDYNATPAAVSNAALWNAYAEGRKDEAEERAAPPATPAPAEPDPRTDDGAALRLAVARGISISFAHGSAPLSEPPPVVAVDAFAGWGTSEREELTGADPYAATRRAVVRAAEAMDAAPPAAPAPAEPPIDPDEGLCWLVELWAHKNWQPTTSTGYYYEGPEWNDMTRDPLRAKRFKTEVDAKLQAGMLIPPSHYQPAQWRATQHEFVGAPPATPAAQPMRVPNPQPDRGYPGCDVCTCPPGYCDQNRPLGAPPAAPSEGSQG